MMFIPDNQYHRNFEFFSQHKTISQNSLKFMNRKSTTIAMKSCFNWWARCLLTKQKYLRYWQQICSIHRCYDAFFVTWVSYKAIQEVVLKTQFQSHFVPSSLFPEHSFKNFERALRSPLTRLMKYYRSKILQNTQKKNSSGTFHALSPFPANHTRISPSPPPSNTTLPVELT